MTYDNLALALVQESNNSILDIDNEISNFNKILESIDILNENNILLEGIDINKFKNKLVEIINAIKEKIEKFIDKIKDIINAIKAKLKSKAFAYIKSKDTYVVYFPTNTLYSDIDRLMDIAEEIFRYKKGNFDNGIDAAFGDIQNKKIDIEDNFEPEQDGVYLSKKYFPAGAKISVIYNAICNEMEKCDKHIKVYSKFVSEMESYVNSLSEEEIRNSRSFNKFTYAISAVNYSISVLTTIYKDIAKVVTSIESKYLNKQEDPDDGLNYNKLNYNKL